MKRNKSTAGFTLVELVIVIAVLGILGGVGAVGYNGYITKTERSADQMIVEAVNKAFATACIENGFDAVNATAAEVSVIDGKIVSLSKCEDADGVDRISEVEPVFNKYFFGNEEMIFKTPDTNSLIWDAAEDTFRIDSQFVATRLMVDGKAVVVSAEDMELIQASAFADMGYSGVATAINNVSSSGKTLAQVAGGLGMMDKLTDVMLANGFITDEQAAQFEDDLSIWNITNPSYGTAAVQAGNGLQMVTAKYLAGANNSAIDELLTYTYSDSTSMLSGLANNGGTKTIASAALQYALVESFANSSASEGTTISYTVNEGSWWSPNNVTYTVSVSEFLASDYAADDPIRAMATVQATTGYDTYKNSEQYAADKNGFVGTMSLLGDNLGTVDRTTGEVKTDGAVSPGDYLANGIGSSTAEQVLTEILGE